MDHSPDTPEWLDDRFREAVGAMDAGDLPRLELLLAQHPRLLRDRLDTPGAWLRDRVGGALEQFFQRPYLLWFVAEDPVRQGTLPPNIAQVTRTILDAARRERVESLREQLDYALRLVSWSWIARDCGVQIALIDVLMDAGASPEGRPDDALVNQNLLAAEHLLSRGATLTLATALCLERWEGVERLAPGASEQQRKFGFVLAALNGKAEALRRMLRHGVDHSAPSPDLFAHGTPLHHAVCSGSMEAVRVLVEAGADLTRTDTLWHATPLGWAGYCQDQHPAGERRAAYEAIAAYLTERAGRSAT